MFLGGIDGHLRKHGRILVLSRFAAAPRSVNIDLHKSSRVRRGYGGI